MIRKLMVVSLLVLLLAASPIWAAENESGRLSYGST